MPVVTQGARGVPLSIAVVDGAGAVVDLSAAESIQVIATNERHQRAVLDHELVTDGTDGLLTAPVPDVMWLRTTFLDWQVLVIFSATSRHYSQVGRIKVVRAL